MDRIIIVNFGGFGDILNTTPIAKHHKISNPNTHITWLTKEKYVSAIKNNKFIDKIITINDSLNNIQLTKKYYDESVNKNLNLKFVAPYTTFFLDNKKHPARSSLLQIIKYETSGIDNFICDFIPNVSLSDEEKKEAKLFFSELKGNKKILFEYENFSNQSPFDEEYFIELCERIQDKNYDLIFTGISKPPYEKSMIKYDKKINFYHYAGSFMSNAELYNLCDVFISTSSGITCLTHSDYCDIDKLRIEVSYGYHWSTFDWQHMKNKHIVFYKQQFKKALNNL